MIGGAGTAQENPEVWGEQRGTPRGGAGPGYGRGQAWPIRRGVSVWRSGLRIPAIPGVGVNSC